MAPFFFSDSTLTEYKLRDGKCKLLIRCLSNWRNTQAISLLHPELHHLRMKLSLCIHRPTLPVYGYRYTHTGAQGGYLTLCRLRLGKKKKQSVVGEKKKKEMSDRDICGAAWVDFHLLPTTRGTVNEVLAWSYHHQPRCPLALYIFSFPMQSSWSLPPAFSLERQCLHISGRTKAGTSFVRKHQALKAE